MTTPEKPHRPEVAGPAASSPPHSLPRHSREGGNPERHEPLPPDGEGLDPRLRGDDEGGKTLAAQTRQGGLPQPLPADPLPADPRPADPLPARAAPVDPGWTPARIRHFLVRFADTGNVLGVCREMGLSRQSAYALRARNEAFARAWQGADLRHRDALVDICLERATVGVTEEIVVDGHLATRTRPDGAMLRHMLARADRRCDDDRLAARPALQSERHFEALLDCLDPPAPDAGEADGAGDAPPDRDRLLADIAASGSWHCEERDEATARLWGGASEEPEEPQGPCGYASDEEALEALIAYKRIKATPPEKIDISDLDPAEADRWTDEQWLRADRSGLSDRMFAEMDRAIEREQGEGDP